MGSWDLVVLWDLKSDLFFFKIFFLVHVLDGVLMGLNRFAYRYSWD